MKWLWRNLKNSTLKSKQSNREEIVMADVKKIATRDSYGNALVELGKEKRYFR